jgi:site-specific recombinase XerD
MAKKQSEKGKLRVPKTVLRLPDLDQAKSAVLNSFSSIDAQRGYRHAIEEFIEWYCSEPRLSFSKTVVLRYRIHLESRHLAPGTVNLRLGAVRRLAYEASDCGLLSPDLAAGIRRVKGVKKIGVRLGNWLTREQSQRLWNAPDSQTLKGKRDGALLAVLLACGLRRHEAVDLDFGHMQQREDHWAIVDLKGKAGHTRTVPMPGWVKSLLDEWLQSANLTAGKLFRRVNKNGKAWGDGLTAKAVWHVVREYAGKAASRGLRLTISEGHVPGCVMLPVANSNRFSFFSGTFPFKQLSDPRLQAAHSGRRQRPDWH